MARTKKQLKEKLAQKINLHKQLLKSSSETQHRGCTSTEDSTFHAVNTQATEGQGISVTSTTIDKQSMTVEPAHTSSRSAYVLQSKVSPGLVRRAVVLVRDISKSPDELLASMVKKQLSHSSPGSQSPARMGGSPDETDSTRPKRSSAADDRETGDKTVSPSMTAGGKNIFDQFNMGRRSPRTRSPRSKQPNATVNSDGSGTRSSSEEKQQQSIVTAVRALRGLSGKVSDGHTNSLHVKVREGGGCRSRKNSPRHSESDGSPRRSSAVGSRNASPGYKESSRNSSPGSTSVRSRNASPGSASPRGHNSTSPKRHSPRRVAEKLSPPMAAVQKSSKSKQSPSSASGSDCAVSPTESRKGRSPHRASNSDVPTTSPRILQSNQGGEKSPGRSGDGKVQKSRTGGDSSPLKVTKPSPPDAQRQHTIHILSSTGRGSKVIQVGTRPSPVSTARRLFVDKDNNNLEPRKQCSPLKSDRGLRSRQTSEASDVTVAPALSATGADHKQQIADEGESLLCAMLVGGSEVTKSYEQSKDKNAVQVSKSQASFSSDRLNESCSSFMNSRDSFFDDDFAGDFPEIKPYELPVLSQLPQLGKPDLAVLDLTKTEKSLSDELPSVQCPPGHIQKTVSILNLISLVKDHLPSDSETCHKVLADAEKVLEEQKSEAETKISEPAADTESTETEDSCVKSLSGKDNSDPADDLLREASGTESAKKPPSPVCHEGLAQALLSETPVDEPLVPHVSTSGDSSTVNPAGDEAMVVDGAGSPSSLGELDTAKMTQAANLAVQNHLSSEPQKEVVETETGMAPLETQQQGIKQEFAVKAGPPQPDKNSLCSLLGTSMAGAGTSKPGNSKSTFRSFFSRISSPSKTRWKPKTEPKTSTGPGWSRWHDIRTPLPIEILSRHEKNSHVHKGAAFASRDLEQYLRQTANRVVIPACGDSKLAKFLLAEGFMKDYDDLQRMISRGDALDKAFEDEEVGVKSEEEEEGEEDERESEVARKLDPDFDEVEGLVFVSFPSEMAVSAHVNVEKSLQWEADRSAYVNMAKFHAFEESRRREGKIRRESQGLRGQHMKWRKYQRLYRKELRKLYEENNKDLPWPLSKIPEKTADVQKIKNWKKKFGDIKTEDLEAMELLGEEEEEERVKRKRKTYVFSSKKKKSKRLENRLEVPKIKEEPGVKRERQCLNANGEWVEEDEEGYGVPIPIDQDDYMDDVHNSLEEMRRKEKGLKKSKGIFARFNMGPEDRHIFKKLGGWVTRFRRFHRLPEDIKKEEGEGQVKSPKKRGRRKGRSRPSFELKCLSMGQAVLALKTLGGESVVDTWNLEQGDAGCHGNNTSSAGEEGDVVDLTAEDATPENKTEKRHCDKPGCRYGCICHLCLPSAESDETEPPATSAPARHACDKEYCRLGCICDSLEKSGTKDSSSKPDAEKAPIPQTRRPSNQSGTESKSVATRKDQDSKKPSGMHQLTSVQQNTSPAQPPRKPSTGDQAESSGDELPTLEKTAPRRQRSVDRYSNLPRRQTSYRMAKNLDAVSRKAMMMWEMSEVYQEQTSNRRKKTPETAAPTAVSTSPAAVTPLSILSSSSTSSSSSHTQQSNTVTAAVSVNTLTASMMSSCVTPSSTAMPPPTVPGSNSAGTTQETSLVVSDEEGHQRDTPEEAKFQSKRSRMKKRLFSKEGGEETQAKKMKTSAEPSAPGKVSSPVPVSTASSTTPATSPPSSTSGKPDPVPSQWHSSLICLKASNPTSASHNNDSDVIIEEEEIKLFEFIANCSWERSKSKILAAITNTLKRGVYPEPRVLHIADFRVEILPKAQRPSVIPKELRSKLPKTMYSVRVKITEAPKPSTPPVQPVNVAQNSLLFPATPIPSFYSGVSSIQGVLPVSGAVSAVCTTTAPVLTNLTLVAPASGSMTSSANTVVSSGSLGISGLGHLQISHNKVSTASMVTVSPSLSMQHYKIQKDVVGASLGPTVEGGEKKKKKKKKKKKNMDPGDDSLVPDLSNLTVSPRRSSVTSPTSAGLPTTATSVTTFRAPGPITTTLRPPVVSVANPSGVSQQVSTSPGNKVPLPSSPGAAPQVRSQLVGLPNLPPNLSGVKFLQLPGQTSLLQIVPASALGLKPMDNKNVPNFVAVPVSLTSVTPAGLAPKKPGGRVQIDIPSKLFAQAQQNLPRPSPGADQTAGKVTMNVGDNKSDSEAGAAKGAASDAKNGAGGDPQPVKKKKKKKKKKELAADNGSDGSCVVSTSGNAATLSSTSLSSSILVASSPTPVMTSVTPCPVQMVQNTHSTASAAGENAAHLSPFSVTLQPSQKPAEGSLESISTTKGETMMMLAKSTEGSSSLKGRGDSVSTTLSTHTPTAHSSGASIKSGVGSIAWSAVPKTTEKSPIVDMLDSFKPCVGDEDSRGSGIDSLDLSSDSEDELDVGTESPSSSDAMGSGDKKKQRAKSRNMAIRRDNEQKRRKLLNIGYKELTRVMNVSNNLPRFLSQQTILSKTVKLIQYHQKISPKLEEIMTNLQNQQEKLNDRLDILISEKLKEGMTMDTIQTVLQQATLPASQDPAASSSSKPLYMYEEAHIFLSSSSRTFISGKTRPVSRKRRENVAGVELGRKTSQFIIEIDRGDEDEVSYVNENSEGLPSNLQASQGTGVVSECETPAETSPKECTSTNSDSGLTGSTEDSEVKIENLTHSETPFSGASRDVTLAQTSTSAGSKCDPLLSCGEKFDEVDGALSTHMEDINSVDNLHDSQGVNSSSAENELMHTGEEHVNENFAEVSESYTEEDDEGGMGLVIASVTSLQGSGINFDDDDLDAGDVTNCETGDKKEDGSSGLS